MARAITDFADEASDLALAEAMRLELPDWRGDSPSGFTVLALGKHGGRELNYSSDIDPILLYDPDILLSHPRRDPARVADRIARRWVALLSERTADGYVFRVDLRLRPSPERSPPAIPIDGAIAHYESSALPWERAAMVRARPAAGDLALGARFQREIRPFVWRRSLDYGAAAELTLLAARIQDAAGDRPTAAPGGDLKRGVGGIRAAEFLIQSLQLIHGGRDPSLRSGTLLDAVDALTKAGRLPPDDAGDLAAAYRRLRTVEHRLQMWGDRQTHELPEGADQLDAIAKLDGLADGAALLADLRPHVGRVAELFGRVDHRPTNALPASATVLAERLGESGFADGEAAARVVAGWRGGAVPALRSAPAQAALEDALPILVAGLAAARDPLTALHRLDDTVRRLPRAVELFRLLGANPPLARLLADVVARSPALADMLAERPRLLDRLLDASAFDEPADADTLTARWLEVLESLPHERALDGLRDRVGEERFALGVQAVLKVRSPGRVAVGYAAVAEAAVRVGTGLVTAEFERRHGRIAGAELVALALGRLGGEALTHASDLDLILLHTAPDGARADGPGAHDSTTYFNRLGQRVVAALSVPTAAGPLYDVDTRLRPSGEQGPLVPSVAAFGRYLVDEAWTWERMALTRARVLVGEEAARRLVDDVLATDLRCGSSGAELTAEIAAMRKRMDEAKPPHGPLDLKLRPGGLVDLEFVVHAIQLGTGQGLQPQLDRAIADMVQSNLLPEGVIGAHRLLFDALFMLRLVGPAGQPPDESLRARVAEACGFRIWAGLSEALDHASSLILTTWRQTFAVPRITTDRHTQQQG